MNRMNPHILKIRVYYEDTDTAGIVYHAQYIKFAERGRTEYLRALGINQIDLQQNQDILLVVHDLQITYLKPAKLDDLLEVHTSIEKLTGARFYMQQLIYLEDVLIAKMHVSVALINSTGKPQRIPEFLNSLLKST